MGILVDFRPPPVQPSNVVNAARSLASLQSLASAAVHYLGYRARRMTSAIVHWGDDDYFDAVGSVGDTVTHHVRLRVSPICTHLFVALIYQAPDDVSGGCQIMLDLKTIAGVTVDGTPTWDSEAGTLQTSSYLGGGFAVVPEVPFLTLHAGVVENPPLVDRPRCLVVDATNRNTDLDLQVTSVNCRIRAVTVWELPTAQL